MPEPITPTARMRRGAPLFPRLPGPIGSAEAFRNLASRVDSRLRGRGQQSLVLCVTSPEIGTGKTLTSLNLALALSRLTSSAPLLVEADIWRPSIGNYLTVAPSGTLTHYLKSPDAKLEDQVQALEDSDLKVLPAAAHSRRGSEPEIENPDELFTVHKWTRLLEDCRASYRLTILDSPPWFTSGAHMLAEQADAVLLMVRAEHSRRSDLDRALKEIPKDKLLGVALNGDRERSSHYTYY